MSKQSTVVSDFGGFDAVHADQLFRMWPKTDPSNYVYVYAHTWIDARTVALLFYKDEKGYHLSYDQVTGEVLDEGTTTIEKRSILLKPDPTGGALAFEATRDVGRMSARRGDNFRQREPVALQRRRQDSTAAGRVQAHREEVVQADTGDASSPTPGGTQGWQGSSASTRVREGAVGDHPVGQPSRANGASK